MSTFAKSKLTRQAATAVTRKVPPSNQPAPTLKQRAKEKEREKLKASLSSSTVKRGVLPGRSNLAARTMRGLTTRLGDGGKKKRRVVKRKKVVKRKSPVKRKTTVRRKKVVKKSSRKVANPLEKLMRLLMRKK